MIDIVPVEHSLWQNLYCALLYTFMLCVGYTANMFIHSRGKYTHYISTITLSIGLFIGCLSFFANDDFFHYYATTKKISMHGPNVGIESFYQYLIFFTHHNYLLFRLFIWGPACILLYLTFRRFKINTNHAYFLLVTCYFITFTYARASLAMSVFFYGLSCIYYPLFNKRWTKIAGLAILLCSPIFHKSMYLLITIWLCSLFLKLNKKTIAIIILSTPVIFIASKLFIPYIIEHFVEDKETLAKIGTYSILVRESQNWKGILQNVIQYATYYLPLYFLIYSFSNENIRSKCPTAVYNLYKLVFLIVLAGSILYFIIPTNNVLFYRTLFMSMIPITIIFTYAVDEKIIKFSNYRIVVWCGITYTYLFLIYTIISTL